MSGSLGFIVGTSSFFACFLSNAEWSFTAVANTTVAEPQDPSQDLPFNYVPTGWIGIVFLTLFGVTTGAFH